MHSSLVCDRFAFSDQSANCCKVIAKAIPQSREIWYLRASRGGNTRAAVSVKLISQISSSLSVQFTCKQAAFVSEPEEEHA